MTATEQLYRLRKALKMADVIWISGLRYENLMDGAAGENFWRVTADGAQFERDYMPSHETRKVVLDLLKERGELERRLCLKKSA